MSGSIRLHEKHGLNPTIPTCFWCGKDKNEIALLGAAYPGQAPMHMVIDRVPCGNCTADMAKGITLVEATGRSDPQPTGTWCVITEDAAKRMFNVDLMTHRKAYIDPETWGKLGLPRENSKDVV